MNDNIEINLRSSDIGNVAKHIVDKTASEKNQSFNDALIFFLKKALTPSSSTSCSNA